MNYREQFATIQDYISAIEYQIERNNEEKYYNYNDEIEEENDWLKDELKLAISQLYQLKENKYE